MTHFCRIYSVENSFLSALGTELDFLAWGSYAVELAHCGLWGAKSFGALFQGMFTALGFLKVLEKSSVFKGMINFQRPSIWNFTLFCRDLRLKVLRDCPN